MVAADYAAMDAATPTLTPTNTPTNTPVPTLTATPTPPTPVTALALTVFLHGIGKSGDNVNPHGTGNMNPLHTSIPFTVTLLNGSNTIVNQSTGNLSYTPATGNFTGPLTLPSSVPTGLYLVKVKTPKFVQGLVPGIIQVTQNQLNPLSLVTLVTGDINNDNSLSILDYNMLINCFSSFGNTPASCSSSQKQAADLNDDGAVDQVDYNLLLREFSVQPGQ